MQDGNEDWRMNLSGEKRERPAPWLEPVMGNEIEEEGVPFKKIVLGLGVLALMALSAVGGWLVGRSQQSDGTILVQAPDDPLKVEPNERGGMNVPNQDKLVLEKAAGVTGEPTETLRPQPEAPAALPQTTAPAPAVVQPQAAAPTPAAPVVTPPAVDPKKAEDAKKAEALKKAEEDKKKAEALKKAEDARKKAEAPKPATASQPGSFTLVLGAYSTEAKAVSVWNTVKSKHGLGLSSSIDTITKADGTQVYRLKAGTVKDRAEADALCAKISSAYQACTVSGK